ncbi:MAG: hypothetical protein EA376_02280 [Phycisphaeraceae bacterium]|nr:MAG: hypothetical protein EA376_02280 [Phycisphaeraceae bacterium]
MPEHDPNKPHEHDRPEDTGAEAAEDGHIPLSPSERQEAAQINKEHKAEIKAPSLLDSDEDDDTCPRCHARMPSPDAVVCFECGFDQASNKDVRTKVGVEEVDAPGEVKVFCKADRIGWKAPLIAGGVALVGAAVLAAINAQEGAALRDVVRVLLYGPIQTGLGFVAVVATARLLEERIGRMDYAAARMALAVGLFYLCFQLGQSVDAHGMVRFLIGAGLGAGLYFAVLWVLFSLTRTAATMLACSHFVMWLLFKLLIVVVNWIERG